MIKELSSRPQWKTTILIIFATLSKSTGKVIFDQLCYYEQKYGKLLF